MKIWFVGTLLMVAAAAQSQTVWRCGPDGRSYSDTPCRDGRALEVVEARPAADLSSARDTARRESALAAQLVRERQQAEASARPGLAGTRGSRLAPQTGASSSPKKSSRAKGRQPLEEPGIFRAVGPASRPKKG